MLRLLQQPQHQRRRFRSSSIRLFLLVCVLFLVLYLLNSSHPALHNIVTETHRQLTNLKHINLQETMRAPEEVLLSVDETYLVQLGFNDSPRLYPEHVWSNVTLPVVVTAASSGQGEGAVQLLYSLRRQPDAANLSLIVYDAGLSRYERRQLTAVCNSTGAASCQLRRLRYWRYPSHLNTHRVRAAVPVIIQEVLNEAGAVLWLDSQFRFWSDATSTDSALSAAVERARRVGIVGWSVRLNEPTSAASAVVGSAGVAEGTLGSPAPAPPVALPTTAFTHPSMFRYFDASPESFYFHKMIDDEALIVFNTERVHSQLMLPWLQCALLWDCVAPLGSQATGCRFSKRPHYRYSGCHGYSTSALNLALGSRLFAPPAETSASYIMSDDAKFYRAGADIEGAATTDPPAESGPGDASTADQPSSHDQGW